MRKKRQKNRCTKIRLAKCKELCKAYDKIQEAHARELSIHPMVEEFSMNVPLDFEGTELPAGKQPPTEEHTTDFVIRRKDGAMAIREAVFQRQLERSGVVELLQLSKAYWAAKGIADWKIVAEEGDSDEAR